MRRGPLGRMAAALAPLLMSIPILAGASPDIGLMTNYTPSPEPLTTADVVKLDPGQPNAYLRRWVLSRTVKLKGLVARRVGKGRIGVQAQYLEAEAISRLRPPGAPWYQDYSHFPCGETQPDPAFATREGTRQIVQQADNLWNRILDARKMRLSILLSQISAPGPLLAKAKAERIFLEWLNRADNEWRARVSTELRAREWNFYREQARKASVCSATARRVGSGKKHRARRASPAPQPLLEPVVTATSPPAPVEDPNAWPSPLSSQTPAAPSRSISAIRAPARRWEGYFAVRADVLIGDRALNGQFVIDPGAPVSILAPSWLETQGAEAAWLEIKEAPPVRARISAGTSDSGLARAAWVQALKVGGTPLDLQRVLIFEAGGIFDEPDFISSCCSGVLGLDVLRQYAVEFNPGPPTEVLLWPIGDFQPPGGYVGAEVREITAARGGFQVFCRGDEPGAFQAKLCQDPVAAIRGASFPVILDLAEGRIWYSPAELQAPFYDRNRTGVRLAYGFVQGGDRVLRVAGLGRTPAARALEREGLRKGMIISEVDGQPATDLDLWQLDRRLAGANGGVVTLRWKTRSGMKMASLRVDGGAS